MFSQSKPKKFIKLRRRVSPPVSSPPTFTSHFDNISFLYSKSQEFPSTPRNSTRSKTNSRNAIRTSINTTPINEIDIPRAWAADSPAFPRNPKISSPVRNNKKRWWMSALTRPSGHTWSVESVPPNPSSRVLALLSPTIQTHEYQSTADIVLSRNPVGTVCRFVEIFFGYWFRNCVEGRCQMCYWVYKFFSVCKCWWSKFIEAL